MDRLICGLVVGTATSIHLNCCLHILVRNTGACVSSTYVRTKMLHIFFTQVEGDYGGYVWTEWMHPHFGDTALHIALKWKRHRAVKALLSLRPNWTVPNEAGTTAEELVLRVYDGKDIATLKDEQEREYENDAMRAEEVAMKRWALSSTIHRCCPYIRSRDPPPPP